MSTGHWTAGEACLLSGSRFASLVWSLDTSSVDDRWQFLQQFRSRSVMWFAKRKFLHCLHKRFPAVCSRRFTCVAPYRELHPAVLYPADDSCDRISCDVPHRCIPPPSPHESESHIAPLNRNGRGNSWTGHGSLSAAYRSLFNRKNFDLRLLPRPGSFCCTRARIAPRETLRRE